MTVPSAETLLCVESDWVGDALAEGLLRVSDEQIGASIPPGKLWLGPRAVLETAKAFRQLVVYCVLFSGERILVFRRERSGESRLRGLFSIGLGGHVNVSDVVAVDGVVNLRGTIDRAVQRELAEEIEWLGQPREIRSRWLGFLRDDSSEVSSVHLGVVAACDLGSGVDEIRVRDGVSVFEHVSRLRDGGYELETWSSTLLTQWPFWGGGVECPRKAG